MFCVIEHEQGNITPKTVTTETASTVATTLINKEKAEANMDSFDMNLSQATQQYSSETTEASANNNNNSTLVNVTGADEDILSMTNADIFSKHWRDVNWS